MISESSTTDFCALVDVDCFPVVLTDFFPDLPIEEAVCVSEVGVDKFNLIKKYINLFSQK